MRRWPRTKVPNRLVVARSTGFRPAWSQRSGRTGAGCGGKVLANSGEIASRTCRLSVRSNRTASTSSTWCRQQFCTHGTKPRESNWLRADGSSELNGAVREYGKVVPQRNASIQLLGGPKDFEADDSIWASCRAGPPRAAFEDAQAVQHPAEREFVQSYPTARIHIIENGLPAEGAN